MLGITDEQIEAMGLHERRETQGLWPDLLHAYNVMCAMRTQWRTGPRCPIGLDYSVVPLAFDMAEVPQEERLQVFKDLQIMEDEFLTEWQGEL